MTRRLPPQRVLTWGKCLQALAVQVHALTWMQMGMDGHEIYINKMGDLVNDTCPPQQRLATSQAYRIATRMPLGDVHVSVHDLALQLSVLRAPLGWRQNMETLEVQVGRQTPLLEAAIIHWYAMAAPNSSTPC